MRTFKIPFDVKREEKIFGGYLSLRQVIYLILAGSSFFISLLPIFLILKIIFILAIFTLFIMCAFLTISEQNFDKFFFYALKYLLSKKKIVYERCKRW